MSREESSSNNASSRWTFHVLLSFRGADTRFDITDHLYAALIRKGIITFRDDIQLEIGDVISVELLKAIEESLAAVIVISKNYASSTWCLDELQKILESKRLLGREVFSVFYGVTPSEVLNQTGSFSEAFRKHERRYEAEKVQKWRDSLTEVAAIPAWVSNSYQHETELIQKIVEVVRTKLHPKMPSFNDELVGIDSRVKKMNSFLKTNQLEEDIRFIGIWGMGGIGKTTLARIVFNKIKGQFEISCFLDNVKEISEDKDGMPRLQRKILSHLKIKGLEIHNLDQGKNTIRNLLSKKKVLLVIDDVDNISQLENLAKQEWFGLGSRVIITTRDIQLLKSHGIVESYEIDILNLEESLQLLSRKAFKRDKPQENYSEFAKKVVKYAGGLPLALKLLGSFLCGRSESQWREVVQVLQQVPESDIVKKSLRISYNGLPERYKTLFLDVACFFKGIFKGKVKLILEICDRYPPIGIELLVEKSLATIDGISLWMHDLLQETGRETVIEECHIDASKRSIGCGLLRTLIKKQGKLCVWMYFATEFMFNRRKMSQLVTATVSESIQGIGLRSTQKSYEANWGSEALSRMSNLKLLFINCDNIKLYHGLKCLSSSLKFFQWWYYPLQALPLGVQLDEVVELSMWYSKITKIWNETQYFAKLKCIDLSYSEDLIQTPIVSVVPCLEILFLHGCKNLVELHQSVAQHKKLVLLNLKNCINLQNLPRKFEMNSMEELILTGCSKIKKLPEFGENMKRLSLLNLENCKNLLCLPNSVSNLKSLQKLYIAGCSKFSRLPDCMDKNESLEELDVSGTAIKDITLSKVHLENLKELSYGKRKELASPNSWNLIQWISKFKKQEDPKELILPPLSSFNSLTFLNLSYCNITDESLPNDLGSLSLLQGLDLSGNHFVNPPSQCINNLSMLLRLSLNNCPMLETLPMLPPNVHHLYATNCTQMKPLNLDTHMLWKIFESYLQAEMMDDTASEPWFIIPGSEIPSWFNNQDSISISPTHHPYNKLDCDSVTTIIVDVPENYQSSEWWGIAMCLVLESSSYVRQTSMAYEGTFAIYNWVCKDPDREPDPKFPITRKYGHMVYEFNDPCIHIIFLPGYHMYIEHYLSVVQTKLELIFYVENNSNPWKPTIEKCGCRVISKKDIENWRNESYGLNISRLTEINDEGFLDELAMEEPASPITHPLPMAELS